MGVIYKGQTKLRIELKMGIDLTGATVNQIKYKKPDGTAGTFSATIKEAATGTLEYTVNVDGSDIDQSGNYYLWTYAVLADTRKIAGEPVIMAVNEEGTK